MFSKYIRETRQMGVATQIPSLRNVCKSDNETHQKCLHLCASIWYPSSFARRYLEAVELNVLSLKGTGVLRNADRTDAHHF